MRPAGTLLHAWRAGEGNVPAFLSDYAYLIHGLLELHEATQGTSSEGAGEWLAAAVELAGEMRRRLAHPDGGFYGAGEGDDLLCRGRDLFDGASPSPNAVAVLDLLRLAGWTGDGSHRDEAERALRGFGPLVEAQPAAARTVAIAVRRFHEAAQPVRARLALDDAADDGWRTFHVHLVIGPGWHVGASEAPPPLIPTTVEGVGCELRDVAWPPPSRSLDGLGDAAVPVWEGEVEIRGAVRTAGGAAPALRVVAQPCDATRCLPAVTLDLPLR
jgi:hypothetical protein